MFVSVLPYTNETQKYHYSLKCFNNTMPLFVPKKKIWLINFVETDTRARLPPKLEIPLPRCHTSVGTRQRRKFSDICGTLVRASGDFSSLPSAQTIVLCVNEMFVWSAMFVWGVKSSVNPYQVEQFHEDRTLVLINTNMHFLSAM